MVRIGFVGLRVAVWMGFLQRAPIRAFRGSSIGALTSPTRAFGYV